MKKPEDYFLGFDVGGTKCAVVVGDNEFNLYEKVTFETKVERGPYAVIDEFKGHVKTLFNKYDHKNLKGIGISCGGPLDSEKGMIYSPPNLPGWDNIPITEIFRNEFGVNVSVQNDANACALAEWLMGSGKGTKNMVFLTFGTGMGAGLILNNRLYAGTNDLGGEVGHIRLADDGPVGFGKAGSFEGFCSGGGIARLAKSIVIEKLNKGEKVEFCPSIKEADNITAKVVFEAARKKDKTAMEIVEITANHLGKGLSIIIDILNPQCIVIGSIYSRNEDLFNPIVYSVLEKEAIPSALAVCKIVPAKLGESIGDYAALCVALYDTLF